VLQGFIAFIRLRIDGKRGVRIAKPGGVKCQSIGGVGQSLKVRVHLARNVNKHFNVMRLLERLSADLTKRFGRGFSRQNLQLFRLFYQAYAPSKICQTLSGESGIRRTRPAESLGGTKNDILQTASAESQDPNGTPIFQTVFGKSAFAQQDGTMMPVALEKKPLGVTEALADIARAKNVLVVVDTTLTPPYAFNSKEFGADIEILSSTKYISGGATSVGGLIIDNGTYDWSKNPKLKEDVKQSGPFALINLLRRQVYRNLGSCLSPHNAFMQSVGLETLPLRVDATSANAHKLGAFLEKHKKVKSAHYPGLKSSPFYAIAKKQFGDKIGGLLTFDLGSKAECYTFMDALKFIRRTTNLNDNRTLALHPASTIFCEYDDEAKKDMNVRDTMVRISVGIEDIDDLKEDINQALDCI